MINECHPLDLEEYRLLIHLDEKFEVKFPVLKHSFKFRESIVNDLLKYLKSESSNNRMLIEKKEQLTSYNEKRNLIKALLTVRMPAPLPDWFNLELDGLLQNEKTDYKITTASKLPKIKEFFPRTAFKASDICVLWQGDITTLNIDGIVNAANKYLLGCFQPFHSCIDNIIHSKAGPRLRVDCDMIIKKQGCLERTGWAKITRAYNLPSKFVIHTVGPIYDKKNQKTLIDQKNELASCYISCLNLVAQMKNIRSLAFCSISTGVYGFPKDQAAKIALKTVEEWLKNNPKRIDLIVFNVFNPEDWEIYASLLKN